MSNNFFIGIDLGTTNSVVGVYRNNHVEIIANEEDGERIIPSCVEFTNDKILAGNQALLYKSQSLIKYESLGDEKEINKIIKNFIFNSKRFIGRDFDEDVVQLDIQKMPFEVVDSNGKPYFQVELENHIKQFSPEYISSKVLSKIKHVANAYLNDTVTDAVITVPAYFNYAQREATIEAAKLSGLNVIQIINEPTAAALAYGFNNKIENKENILVVDFGGGTYDVSLISIKGRKYNVKAVSGDTHLGGEDLTSLIVDYFIEEIKDKYKVDVYTRPESKVILSRLRNACETAKINLSLGILEKVEIVNLFDETNFSSTITRAKFEELNSDLYEKLIRPIKNVLNDSRTVKSDIEDIVLVGGSTRIPLVREIISSFFNKEVDDLKKSVNPIEAVAYGAAVQAFKLKGKNAKTRDFFVKDVVPLSLGTSNGNKMDIIIKRNSAIPIKNTKLYYIKDNQKSLLIDVYEGDNENVKDNKLLDKFTLEGIKFESSDNVIIDVTFEINDNGILKVSAKEKGTNKYNEITIKNSKGRIIQEMVDNVSCNIL